MMTEAVKEIVLAMSEADDRQAIYVDGTKFMEGDVILTDCAKATGGCLCTVRSVAVVLTPIDSWPVEFSDLELWGVQS